eukprot:CAMPEP_0171991104 /NCGR_PEP_ID=MMETSP0993-20121228/277258_1 /TAXON_ID=483369 /ORGANISM="non described non described, Strain CCMP2098" /LENGTH=201 /DNA_ID=CAMNT_0012644123 /DNA_START=722 /DNA_END=1327 /DNA_ORIENTATION=-
MGSLLLLLSCAALRLPSSVRGEGWQTISAESSSSNLAWSPPLDNEPAPAAAADDDNVAGIDFAFAAESMRALPKLRNARHMRGCQGAVAPAAAAHVTLLILLLLGAAFNTPKWLLTAANAADATDATAAGAAVAAAETAEAQWCRRAAKRLQPPPPLSPSSSSSPTFLAGGLQWPVSALKRDGAGDGVVSLRATNVAAARL